MTHNNSIIVQRVKIIIIFLLCLIVIVIKIFKRLVKLLIRLENRILGQIYRLKKCRNINLWEIWIILGVKTRKFCFSSNRRNLILNRDNIEPQVKL